MPRFLCSGLVTVLCSLANGVPSSGTSDSTPSSSAVSLSAHPKVLPQAVEESAVEVCPPLAGSFCVGLFSIPLSPLESRSMSRFPAVALRALMVRVESVSLRPLYL